MYITKGICREGFIVKTDTDGFAYNMDKEKKEGSTPVGLLSSALTGCVAMCVRGYYLKKGLKDVSIQVISEVEQTKISVYVYVDKDFDEIEEKEVFEYVDKMCTVSKMLSKDIPLRKKLFKM